MGLTYRGWGAPQNHGFGKTHISVGRLERRLEACSPFNLGATLRAVTLMTFRHLNKNKYNGLEVLWVGGGCLRNRTELVLAHFNAEAHA